ncbi:nucleotide-binding alpha-beta plait domain-containing protein [Tanacetum coccineum]
MGSFRTKEDDVAKISTSVFITNFPESCSAKELFQSCKQYGHVVDTFIPTKRSKNGRRFGFVRFINVFNEERLVNNLCTVWIDRFKLHANIARFHRPPLKEKNVITKRKMEEVKQQFICLLKEQIRVLFNGGGNSYVHVVKGQNKSGIRESEVPPALVLNDECLLLLGFAPKKLRKVPDFMEENEDETELLYDSTEGERRQTRMAKGNVLTRIKGRCIKFVVLRMKLKFLKAKIREWNKSNLLSGKNVKAKYKEELEVLEAIIDRGDGNEEIVNKRMEVVNNIQKFDKIHSSEMAQKAKSEVSNVKIKRAVWDCGTDKSPYPDGFTFGFYRRFWKIIENDVYDAVKYFFTYGNIPKVGVKLAQPSLEYSFRRNPRGGVEQDQFNELSALVHDVSLIPMSDRWKWDLESSGVVCA